MQNAYKNEPVGMVDVVPQKVWVVVITYKAQKRHLYHSRSYRMFVVFELSKLRVKAYTPSCIAI